MRKAQIFKKRGMAKKVLVRMWSSGNAIYAGRKAESLCKSLAVSHKHTISSRHSILTK